MDINYKIDELVARAKDDRKFASLLTENPVKAIKSNIGCVIPDDQIAIMAQTVLARMDEDYAGSVLGSIQKMF